MRYPVTGSAEGDHDSVTSPFPADARSPDGGRGAGVAIRVAGSPRYVKLCRSITIPMVQRLERRTAAARPRIRSLAGPKSVVNSPSLKTSATNTPDSPEGASVAIAPPAGLLVIASPSDPL